MHIGRYFSLMNRAILSVHCFGTPDHTQGQCTLNLISKAKIAKPSNYNHCQMYHIYSIEPWEFLGNIYGNSISTYYMYCMYVSTKYRSAVRKVALKLMCCLHCITMHYHMQDKQYYSIQLSSIMDVNNTHSFNLMQVCNINCKTLKSAISLGMAIRSKQ